MISKEQVNKVASLAQLRLSEEEALEISQQLSKALENFNAISSISTQGVEPLVTPSPVQQYLRPDRVEKEVETEALLANAPSRLGNLFKVPPVVG